MKYIIPNMVDGKFFREDGSPIHETPREVIFRAVESLLEYGVYLHSHITLRGVDDNKSTVLELIDLDKDPDEPKTERVAVVGLQPEILEAHLVPVATGASNSPDPDVVEWVKWFADRDELVNSRLQGCAVSIVSELEHYGIDEPAFYNGSLENIFMHHPPCGDQVKRYEVLRDCGKQLAEVISKLCPPSGERTTAIERIRESIMWANASIACNEQNTDEKPIADSIKEQIEAAKAAYQAAIPVEDDHDPKWEDSRDEASDPNP